MIRITIRTDNAAFQDGNRDHEVARILARLAQEWDIAHDGYRLRDVNGNTIGHVALTGADRRRQ